ncbi:MAG: HDOD domain-containing protein [Zoogloeaceae bacterium]|jgi:HD-like signal output (HDOD) protein|nr:HDOD domain-containing protein [Zoogloeaceae bacterium]
MTQQIIFKILEDIAQDLSRKQVIFPTFLDVTFKVHTALKDPNLNIEQLTKLVSVEPLMSAKIVRIANSVALSASSQPVADVKSAIARVGMETVRTVSFAIAIEQLIQSNQMRSFTDLSKKIWDHTVYVAAICRILAPKIAPRLNAEEAMFAGLVHDIGAFYLLSCAAPFPELVKDREALFDLLLGWHDSIGHALLSALDQPEQILIAVQEHEQDREIGKEKHMSDMLFIANKIANTESCWYANPGDVNEQDVARIAQILDANTLRNIREKSMNAIISLKQALAS